jgi:hypothetical protein
MVKDTDFSHSTLAEKLLPKDCTVKKSQRCRRINPEGGMRFTFPPYLAWPED